jgi:predicted AAA+ superfamily ATPase
MIDRHLRGLLLAALADRPVVLLHGPRRAGKTTLARALAGAGMAGRYLTLDTRSVLDAARSEPADFIAGLDGPVILDEVQRAPDLLLAIKEVVDRDRQPGRFLLTGSANVLLLPRLSETLAGRMEIVTLWPFSQGEIEGRREQFIDIAFSDRIPATVDDDAPASDLIGRVLRGGYPEAVAARSGERRNAWFESYLATMLSRDAVDPLRIEAFAELSRMLSNVAARSISLFNASELSRSTGIAVTTLKRYVALLERMFLLVVLPPWHVNIGKRLVKSPKLLLSDCGLAAHLAGMDARRLSRDRSLLGGLLENFVVMEFLKQRGWSRVRPSLFHFRAHDGTEVDLVLETRAGDIVGIEVKSATTVASSDFKGLRALSDATGQRFHRGMVLYDGNEVIPYGKRLHAVPISALWHWGAIASNAR